MKKTNLLMVVGLSICVGGSALNITANFNKEKTEITQPKKANENLNTFTLELNQTNQITTHTTIETDRKIYFRKQEFSGYNEALMANLEMTSEVLGRTLINQDNTTWIEPSLNRGTPNKNTTCLIKYQLTPYKSLYDSKTSQKLYTTINITNTTEPITLKLKITAYTSTQDWSTYIRQTNWNTQQNNYNIIQNIINPQNQQTYNEETQILTLTIDENITRNTTIETQVEIRENLTTYHFIMIEPYIESETSIYQKLQTINAYTFMGLDTNPKPTIKGYIIPNINNYEVIDIPSLLFTILTMPFAFISQAFNLTLFPGTPYQINISNLFLTILAILIFVFIVKLFINK